jgi:hypothetical protein
MIRRLAVSAAFVSAACLPGVQPAEPLAPGGHHVLFIGNSLTYTNDLPATVAAIAASAGDTIRVAMEAGPNLALIDHYNGATNALRRIASGGWEFVILQQGPTPPGICRDSLVLWTKMFDPHIRAVGARTAVFMSWPYAGPLTWFDDIEASFEHAATAVNGAVFPVAEAWRTALRADASLALYSPDGLHPTPVGTFLTALEIYERVTGKDARSLPPKAFANGVSFSLPEATIRALQAAAHEASGKYPVTGAPPRAPAATATRTATRC